MLFVLIVAGAGIAVWGAVTLRRAGSLDGRLRLLFIGVVAGAVAGLTLGAGLRIAMRIAALMGGGREVTVGGTLAILFAPAGTLAVFGIAFASLRRAVRVAGLPLGLAFGFLVLLLCLPFLQGGGELEERGVLWVNQLTFGASFFAYGLTMGIAIDALDRRVPGAPLPRRRLRELLVPWPARAFGERRDIVDAPPGRPTTEPPRRAPR